ncbi:UNVERIFIED_CONTAM: hypothetical protein K2H54_065105 [Gekko kuhli]
MCVNRHTYRLGFVQRGMVRLRQMVQRWCRGHQSHAGRQRQDPLGHGVPEAPQHDSPPASGGEGGEGVCVGRPGVAVGPSGQPGPPTVPGAPEEAGIESCGEEAEGPHQVILGEGDVRGGVVGRDTSSWFVSL